MVGKIDKTKYNKTMKVKKTKKTTAKKKDSTKKSEEPWVKVLDMNVNPDNPRNGFFELDWNDEFVNMLDVGIIDPLKVVRSALEHASSAACNLLSVGCAMIEDDSEASDDAFLMATR